MPLCVVSAVLEAQRLWASGNEDRRVRIPLRLQLLWIRQRLGRRCLRLAATLPVSGEDQLDAFLTRFLGVHYAGGYVAVLPGRDLELLIEFFADPERAGSGDAVGHGVEGESVSGERNSGPDDKLSEREFRSIAWSQRHLGEYSVR
jgi:hypothetical protein